MPGVELSLKEYLYLPGVKLGLKDHLQDSRTTAQSSLEKLTRLPSSSSHLVVAVDIRRAFRDELLLCQPVRRVCVKRYKKAVLCRAFFQRTVNYLCLVGDIVKRGRIL